MTNGTQRTIGREVVSPPGSITDVAGIRVGHHQRRSRGWQTGTTVIFAPEGATPGVAVRGGGPGTRETDALHPENLVQQIHAVCLTGGSAFGLGAADGVVAWLEQRGLGFPVGATEGAAPHTAGVVPVVPAAVVFDLARGGRFANRPDADFGRRAITATRIRQRAWGSVGAGTGARSGGLQGGVGTASTTVTIPASLLGDVDPNRDDAALPDATNSDSDTGSGAGTGPGTVGITVGAMAVVNSNGSAIDPATALPWSPEPFELTAPGGRERRRLAAALTGQAAAATTTTGSLNTTIGVVATSAALTKSEVTKMAGVAHDGLARAIRPAHSMFDGDTVFGLATGAHDLGNRPSGIRSAPSRHGVLNLILAAAADTFAAACTHAVLSAATIGEAPAYLDVCPSAARR